MPTVLNQLQAAVNDLAVTSAINMDQGITLAEVDADFCGTLNDASFPYYLSEYWPNTRSDGTCHDILPLAGYPDLQAPQITDIRLWMGSWDETNFGATDYYLQGI